MAEIKSKLPPHCVIKKRKNYEDIYFHVHPKDRPEGWPASIKIGRANEDHSKLISKANELYDEFIEFRASKAIERDIKINKGSIPHIVSIYKNSYEWEKLGSRTKKDYDGFIANLVDRSKKVDNPHISQMTTKHIMQWLNTYHYSPNRQRIAKVVISIIFSVAVKEGIINRNIVKEIRLSYKKIDKNPIVIWEAEDLNKFVEYADKKGFSSLALAALIGYETGQRPSDLYKLQRPRDYENGTFVFKQNKTGKSVTINASERLKNRIDKIPKSNLILCQRRDGTVWKADGAAKVVRRLCNEIGLPNHQMKFFRHTLVRDSERAGISDDALCALTGHSRETIKRMKDMHYGIDRDAFIAQKVVKDLSDFRQSQTKKEK